MSETVSVKRPAKPTAVCRCWACGGDEPMGCGALCADCSWDDHCGGIAHNGDTAANWEPCAETPACCLAAHATKATS